MNLIDQLKRDEGVKLKPYVDTVGKLTIGVGRNLTDVGISSVEVDFLLSNDIQRAEENLAKLDWYQGLDPVRQAAVTNMCFNLGIGGLLHFPTMLHCLAVKDYDGASAAALASKWAEQLGYRADAPLASRPGRIAQQLRTGEWT